MKFAITTLLLLLFCQAAGAAPWIVRKASGDVVTVIHSGAPPQTGQEVEFYFEIEGLGEKARKALGTVVSTEATSFEAKITPGTQTGQIVGGDLAAPHGKILVPPNPAVTEPKPRSPLTHWKFTGQRYVTGESFPKEKIKTAWKEGYDITGITRSSKYWYVILSKGLDMKQSYRSGTSFPKEDIREKWEEGYNITSIAHGNGKWYVVFSSNTGIGKQSWITRSAFPKDEINEKWDEGYQITSMAFGNGKWAIVFSRDSGIERQNWVTRKSSTDIYQYASERWRDTPRRAFHSLNRGATSWAALFSDNLPQEAQFYQISDNFPREMIREKWEEGYYITNLEYGAGYWGLVMSQFGN